MHYPHGWVKVVGLLFAKAHIWLRFLNSIINEEISNVFNTQNERLVIYKTSCSLRSVAGNDSSIKVQTHY